MLKERYFKSLKSMLNLRDDVEILYSGFLHLLNERIYEKYAAELNLKLHQRIILVERISFMVNYYEVVFGQGDYIVSGYFPLSDYERILNHFELKGCK
jgi:hypothetical protein